MCGITGFISIKNDFNWAESLKLMNASLIHRGPDDEGTWMDKKAGIALGQRRLSIVDLSPAGHQPMHSRSGRYVMVFNGEIYNYSDIRKELESCSAIRWRGHSDTEVMLQAIEQWGIEHAVKKFVGMFAFAMWDREQRVLQLVRDRLGEKPLYYGWVGDTFLFASELKALRAHPKWRGEIDRHALTLFFRHNYIPTPYSIYGGISKLTPGTILSMGGVESAFDSNVTSVPQPYWQASKIVQEGTSNPFNGNDQEAIELLEQLLREAVACEMVADVPLGAFLSGGVDSSTIVALMQTQSNMPVRTFTIGFNEKGYNEADDAKAVALHLGTDHTELYITAADALAVIPELPRLYDEPFADSSHIPTYLVSKLTRRYVTVSLSGDAGDELFAGYNRYFWGKSIWSKIRWMPKQLRSAGARLLQSLSPQAWDNIFRSFNAVFPSRISEMSPGDKIYKLAEILTVQNPLEMYKKLISHWKEPSSLVNNGAEPGTVLTDNDLLSVENFTHLMMYIDLVMYLPDDILVKVDRAAMSVSLETRVPFLDHRVVEFAWRLPLSMKIRNGRGKWILKQVLNKYVPAELIERPKTGFGVPIDLWLRGPLRDWAESLLSEKRLLTEGFLNPRPIRQKWHEHLSGRRNWQYYLWDVLMFQAWLEQNKN